MQRTTVGHRRILVIEEHAIFAEALEVTLAHEGHDVRRVGPTEIRSLNSLRAAALRSRPRIVLLGRDLGRLGDATPLVAPLARSGIDVVVLTRREDHAEWGACLEQGAATVISTSTAFCDVLGTIRRLQHGLPVLADEVRESWLRALQESPVSERARLQVLTPRERAVLNELVEGRSVTDIAASGVVSEATVRTQVKSVLAKLGVSSQLAAVALADRAHRATGPGGNLRS